MKHYNTAENGYLIAASGISCEEREKLKEEAIERRAKLREGQESKLQKALKEKAEMEAEIADMEAGFKS